eukprot:TRINITY_DN9485_c0_g1_i2.p1 TRINITY_DN9485_c0_g1~~TRINITY_DN9485_c0_g1_i2.p1  ORF type:complete len:756 (-),score=95.60 TRINITY_DN9485_c0_g1_i2:194-2461(-)
MAVGTGPSVDFKTVKALQAFLQQDGENVGPIDGIWGSSSARALQSLLKKRGYFKDSIDGKFGRVSVQGMQQWLTDSGCPCGVDGSWGNGTTLCLQQFLGRGQDGADRSGTIKALQSFLQRSENPGTVDGVWGNHTVKALQSLLRKRGYYGDGVDGNFGGVSVKALQQWLTDSVVACGIDGKWGKSTTHCLHRFFDLGEDGADRSGTIKALQSFLQRSGQNPGPVDGIWGKCSARAMQSFLEKRGYYGDGIDANFGGVSVKALQQWLTDSGVACGIDGKWGKSTTHCLHRFLDLGEDGADRSGTMRAVQSFLQRSGENPGQVDGIWGKSSARAMQSLLKKRGYYNDAIDGVFARVSVRGLQQWLTDSGFPCSVDGLWGSATTHTLHQFLETGEMGAETREVGESEEQRKAYREDRIRDMFEEFDADGDGVLSFGEFTQIFSGLEADDASIQTLFSAIDADQDGCISLDELIAFVFDRNSAGLTGHALFRQACSIYTHGWCLQVVRDWAQFAALEALFKVSDPHNLGKGRDAGHFERSYTNLKLVHAWKIVAPGRQDVYEAKKKDMSRQLRMCRESSNGMPTVTKLDSARAQLGFDEVSVNQQLLLHGTKPDTILHILQNGLDERFSGGLFGKGIYLAEDPSKIDQYCRAETGDLNELLYCAYGLTHPGEIFYSFAIKVALGMPVSTKDAETDLATGGSVWATSDKRQLAVIPNTDPPIHYHSLVAETGGKVVRHREFVVFNGDLTVPEYLIAYKRI